MLFYQPFLCSPCLFFCKHHNKMLYNRHEEITTIGFKNLSHTLFSKEVGASVVWGRRIQLAILTNNFFSWPYHAVLSYILSSRRHWALLLHGRYSTGGPLWVVVPAGRPAACWFSRDSFKTEVTLPVSHMGICIHHFITPKHIHSITWLLPFIFPGTSCAENLWLTARSRVNMQHKL